MCYKEPGFLRPALPAYKNVFGEVTGLEGSKRVMVAATESKEAEATR